MEAERGEIPGGYIARTASAGLPPGELARDMAFVRARWAEVGRLARTRPAPALLQADLDLVLRTTRDLFTDEIAALHVDSAALQTEVVGLLADFAPHLRDRVRVHQGPPSLLSVFGLERVFERARARTVPLRSGGSLVIDEAEAFTAIDVNTGSFVGSSDLESTLLKTNLEAATAAARQIRLRNLGGIIIVDFIDMEVAEHRAQVEQRFSAALGRDRAKIRLLPMNEFGLLELTRRRTRPSLGQTLTERCPTCAGSGAILRVDSVCQQILADLPQAAPIPVKAR
jgi:ribonuclease G